MIILGKRHKPQKLPKYISFRGKRYLRGAHFATHVEALREISSLRRQGIPAQLYADGLTVYHRR